jgi:predicted RNA-binding Zn ribbon-like protein
MENRMVARPPAIFIGEAAALDFLNSIATPVDTPIDWIRDGEGFLAWLEEARLVPPQIIRAMEKQALPGELDNVAAQARSLREWFRKFVNSRKGKPLALDHMSELEPLNRLLERDEAFRQVVRQERDDSFGLRVEALRRWRSPDALLLPIGEALANFVCEEDFTHVKACEGQSCTLMFADHTRRRARRWCSMALCGNRAKQAAYRHRVQAAH